MEVIRAALKLGTGAHKAIALTTGECSHSYAQLLRSAGELSSRLHAVCRRGDDEKAQPSTSACNPISREDGDGSRTLRGARVGIMAIPSAEFVVGMWGTWLCGGVAVPLALTHPEAELLHVLNDANVSMVITTEDHRSLIETVSEQCSARLCVMSPICSTEQTLNETKQYEKIRKEVADVVEFSDDQDAGLIIYTSGTTGRPKGAVHTHAGMGAQFDMLTQAWGYSAADCFLHCLPLHHVHGLFNALLAPLYAGATVHFMPKFSVRGVWEKWSMSHSNQFEKAVTCFTGVPTMYVRLLQGYESMDIETQKMSAAAAGSLRLMMCGSSAMPIPVMNKWEKVTSHRLLERYGMTEFGMALSNPLKENRKSGTVGKPLPGVEYKIVEDATHPQSGTGELCIKSPSMFKEYWNQPEVTKNSFLDDGYFMTGDSVCADSDGYLQILGRTSVDIIKSGGYKLSSLEIESILLDHPEIRECAVLGQPDESYGEVVAAVVAQEAEPFITLDKLHEWASTRMAPYKVPQVLHIWKSLPRNAMGKVNKKELKKMLLEEVKA